MICNKCGKEIADNSLICSECGEKSNIQAKKKSKGILLGIIIIVVCIIATSGIVFFGLNTYINDNTYMKTFLSRYELVGMSKYDALSIISVREENPMKLSEDMVIYYNNSKIDNIYGINGNYFFDNSKCISMMIIYEFDNESERDKAFETIENLMRFKYGEKEDEVLGFSDGEHHIILSKDDKGSIKKILDKYTFTIMTS